LHGLLDDKKYYRQEMEKVFHGSWLASIASFHHKEDTLVFWSWVKPSLAEGCCFAFVFVAVAGASFKASARDRRCQ